MKLLLIATLAAASAFAQMQPAPAPKAVPLAPILERIDALNREIAMHPGDAELTYRLGRAYQQLAAAAFESLKAVAPHAARTYQALGENHGVQGDTQHAIEFFQKAAAADPKLPGSHLALAMLYKQTGRMEEAARELDRELAIAPDSAVALALRSQLTSANSPFQPGEAPAQTETLTARLAKAPLSEDERSSVIQAIAKHDYTKAAHAVVEAIQRKPQSAELLTASAGLFFVDRQYLNTAIVLKRAEKIAPLAAADRLLLALAYIAMQHNDWARPELEKLAAQDPASIAPTYWLARIDYDERRYNEAIEKLRAVTTAQPAFLRGWDNLALAYEGAGLLEDAASAYEKAVELNRGASAPSVWPPLNYATLLERVGRIADAEKLLAEAARYDPKSAQVHYRLGLAHEKSGRDSAAIDEFREAAKLDAKYADPLYALARLLYKKGDTASAESTMAAYRRVKSGRVIPGH